MVASKKTVFLFIGDDAYLKEKALQDLRSSLPGNSAGRFDQHIFRGGELNVQEVFDRLTSLSLLSDNRIIVIKDLESAPDDFRASLIEYIKKPSPSSYLILDAKSDSVLRDYDEALKNVSVRIFGIPTGASLVSWIKKYVASFGKTIDDDALLILRELEHSNLSYISHELDKLISFTGDRKDIRAGDAEEVIGKSLVLSAFDIADAVGRRNAPGAIKISVGLLAEGKKESEIIGLLCWHMKRLLRAKALKSRGESDHVIAGTLKVGARFQGEFFKQLSGFKFERLKSGIEMLLQGDLEIKRTKFDPGTILELTLVRLCLL